jgi:phosphoribosyl 1,2-cyclic phosphate phosphodiesterase
MRVEILGSGGAGTTPRPLCECGVCAEAREKGIPYARTGPSIFVHGPDLLFDTPEESKQQLNRAGITRIEACFYSHWHPDHTMGRRVFESIGADWRTWPPEARQIETTPVYLPERVAADFRRFLGHADHFAFMAEQGYVSVVEMENDVVVQLHHFRIRAIQLAETYVYAFLIEGDGKRVLLALDELRGWVPPDHVRGVDLAVLPAGFHEIHPLTGDRLVSAEHWLLKHEATFPQTLAVVEQLGAKRVVLTHIEDMNGLNHDEWLDAGRKHGVEIAYDGLVLEV